MERGAEKNSRDITLCYHVIFSCSGVVFVVVVVKTWRFIIMLLLVVVVADVFEI